MKQGKATYSGPGARKVEPKPHAMSPAGVAQMGKATGGMIHGEGSVTSRNTSVSMYDGKGYKAPMVSGRQVHSTGSQGRHR
jgi:hypothetical protein